jgi:psiF repeat-containing protein
MMLRFAMAAGLAVTLVGGTPASAATPKQKMETCKFGADDQKLQGAARKKFMANCMANRDSPRGKPVDAPRQ